MRKLNNKKLSSKQLSLLLAGSIALTSLVGCAKANTSETTEVTTAQLLIDAEWERLPVFYPKSFLPAFCRL